MANTFKVMNNFKEEDTVYVHMPHKIVKFKQMTNGLYGMNPNHKDSCMSKEGKFQMLNTVEENIVFLSPRQQ